MTWGRLDDQFFECEKVQALLGMPGGKAALVLHFSALTYCSRHLTDGELTPAAVQKAAHDAQVSRALALLLVRVKLWEMRRGKRLFIHDYLDYNPSRTEVEAKRREKARAGQAGGLATARARAAAKPQQNCTPVPYPSHTRPIPKETTPPTPPTGPSPPEERTGSRLMQAVVAIWPGAGAVFYEGYTNLEDEYGPDFIWDCWRAALESGQTKPSVRYLEAIARRCKAEGREPNERQELQDAKPEQERPTEIEGRPIIGWVGDTPILDAAAQTP